MFLRDETDPSFKLGIDVHQFTNYHHEGTFLRAKASFDKTHREFFVSIEPHYDFFKAIKDDSNAPPKRRNTGRYQSIDLGAYAELDMAEEICQDLESFYLDILKDHGAEKHVLRENGNSYSFAWNDAAADTRLGHAIIQARTLYVFEQVKQNKALDHLSLAGRIMPVLMHAVGVKNYAVDQDLSQDGFDETSFVIGGIAIFKIYKPLKPGGPCYFQRYDYHGGDDYRLAAEHEAYGEAVQGDIIDWLADKMAARAPLPREDYDGYMGELAMDVKRQFLISADEAKKPPVKLILPGEMKTATILNFADFRLP